MIAKVSTTSRITRSVLYGQDEQKGGQVLLYNCVDITATPEEQAADLNAMSNPSYRIKGYNFILSFDDKDTEKMRHLKERERYDFIRKVIRAFIEEMVRRGTNITDCPFVVARHGNTDNEHCHMTVLTTTIDNKHIRDSFIKKNAIRAAACVSERFGLRAAPRALRNELAHQVAASDDTTTRTRRVRTNKPGGMDTIQERMRRREAIERANRYKEQLRRLIEKIAKVAAAADFAERLKAEGLTLIQKKKDWGVTATLEDGKERTYTFGQLMVDAELVTPLLTIPKVADVKPGGDQAPAEKPSKESKTATTKRVVPSPSRFMANALKNAGRLFNAGSGKSSGQSSEQSRGQSKENEVSMGDHVEPEENIRRGGRKR